MDSQLLTANYQYVRESLQPGDIIAFSGRGLISRGIAFFTGNAVSHVGIVFKTGSAGLMQRVMLMESTTMINGKSGAQSTYMSERVEDYDGVVWWLPLSKEARARLDLDAYWQVMEETKGVDYDYRSIFHFLIDRLRLWSNSEDPRKLFCSEWATLGLKAGRVLPIWINSSDVRPCDLCAFQIYSDYYYQLNEHTTPTYIKGFNSLHPMSWRNK